MNRIFKRILLAIICIGPRAADVTGQTVTPVQTALGRIVSASPEASSIALYQNYPVDYVSGVPNIEIPLFDIPTRAGVIPFKLSYHIGKLKPSEQVGGPGWGWTVSPNLGITRAVKGGIDGVSGGYPANTFFGQTNDDYFLSASTNGLDEQPDDFFYSLLSKSGQFIYNRKGGFTPVSYDAVKITHTDNNTFVITDDDGTIYKFGKYSSGSDVKTEFSGTGSGTPTTLTSWKITEIIPYDKSDTIRFVYGTKMTYTMAYYNIQWQFIETLNSYDPIGGLEKPVNIYQNVYNNNGGITTGAKVLRPTSVHRGNSYDFDRFDFMLPIVPENDYKILLTQNSTGSTREQTAWGQMDYGADHLAEVMSDSRTDQLQLAEIRFKGGKVLFNYEDSQLYSIYAYSKNEMIKRARLYQHQLQHDSQEQPFPYYNNLNERYGLDSVTISGSDANVSMTYRMNYAVKSASEECVGVYGNYNTDFWGYVNSNYAYVIPHLLYYVNKFTWNSLLENTNTANLEGSPKNGSGWVMVGSPQEKIEAGPLVPGIIKRLYYPTGGYAEFDFENNMYPSSADPARIVYGGGYRIKQIKYTTGDGRDSLISRYKYGIGEDGVGRTKYKNYSQNFISVQYVNSSSYGLAGNLFQKIATINSKPFLDMSFASGAAVLYQQVSTYMINPTNNETLGKTVYDYVIDSKNDAWVANTPLQADSRTDWRDISHVATTQYRYSNGRYNIIGRTTNKYTDYYTDTVPAAQTFLTYYNANPQNGTSVIAGNPTGIGKFAHINYNIYAGGHKLTEVRDTVFNADDSLQYLATVNSIAYDATNLYTSSIYHTDSKGLLKKTEVWYPYQAAQITDLIPGQQTPLAGLVNANRINVPVETKEYSQGTLLRTAQQNFSQFAGSKILPSAVYASVLNNPLEKKIELTQYDNYGNLLEQQKANDVKETYVWGYRSHYPVAKVVGSNLAAVQSFVNQVWLDSAHNYTDDEVRVELAKIRTGLAGTNAQVLTYTYKPIIGITSETDANGRTTYYEYDGLNRLEVIRDQNGNILKQYAYYYKKVLPQYRNEIKSQQFKKVNCGDGVGVPVTYTVSVGRYTSYVSQEDADAKALNDIAQNGQTYANTNGSCRYFNTPQSGSFTKSCVDGVGSVVVYSIAAKQDSSFTSVADANAKALVKVNAGGPAYANQNGTCTYSNNAVSRSAIKACGVGYLGTTVTYPVAAGKYTTTFSKDSANKMGLADLDANTQTYANTNGQCQVCNVLFSKKAGSAELGAFSVNVKNSSTGVSVYSRSFNDPTTSTLDICSVIATGVNYTVEISSMGNLYATVNGTEKLVTSAGQSWTTTPTINMVFSTAAATVYKNAVYTKIVTKNCAGDSTGSPTNYTVPANMFSSTISQWYVDSLAIAYANVNGQAYANANGFCLAAGTNVAVRRKPGGNIIDGAYSIKLKNPTTNVVVLSLSSLTLMNLPVYRTVPAGAYIVELSGMSPFNATVNGVQKTISSNGTQTWNTSTIIDIIVWAN